MLHHAPNIISYKLSNSSAKKIASGFLRHAASNIRRIILKYDSVRFLTLQHRNLWQEGYVTFSEVLPFQEIYYQTSLIVHVGLFLC
jgi:hypothetical protein